MRFLVGRIATHLRQTRDPVSTSDQSAERTIDYLSLAWIRELTREVAESSTLAELAQRHRIGVTQVVTDTPEGDVTYHLQVGDGSATFGAGAAEPEDVRMQQDHETAVAVATGALNAQEAFVTGRILLFGDREALMGAQDVFAALDAVFTSVRDRTRYTT
jgi:putative sterol carrier protein